MGSPENISRISAPERIERLLGKACEAKLGAMMRLNEADTVAVRGNMLDLVTLDGIRVIKIGGLSVKGMQHLTHASQCVVELVMMNTKVVFASFVIKFFGDAMFMTMPAELVNIERRKNSRVAVPANQAAFLSFSDWHPKATELNAPPSIFGFEGFAGWIRIGDLSMGGISAQMLAPGPAGQLERGFNDRGSRLHLPSQEPIKVHSVIRWTKRISDWTSSNRTNKYTRIFKIGCEFIDLDPKATTVLHQAIRDFTIANAV